jgi:hypothetical protein
LVGSVSSPAPQGTLTSELPPHASPDTINALSVDLTLSQGQLGSVSPTDAANLVTLCYAGGELLSYQSATLTGPHQYKLTTLYRGAYGSAITDHPAGAPFVRLDGSVGRFPYPNSLIGQTVYLKFASLNIVGGGLQSLASVPAFPTRSAVPDRHPRYWLVGPISVRRLQILYCRAMYSLRRRPFRPVFPAAAVLQNPLQAR